MTAPPITAVHPLDPLTASELSEAVKAARAELPDAVVVSAFLDEPAKAELRAFAAGGEATVRRAVAVLYAAGTVHEVLVAGERRLASRAVKGAVPHLGRAELEAAAAAV